MNKLLIVIPLFLLFNACSSKKTTQLKIIKEIKYKKQFTSIWEVVKTGKYTVLPQNTTSYSSLSKDKNATILKNAQRTLKSKKDILPYFDKLVHPNGICFKGTWNINKQNIYSGYFKKDTKALIIARASSAISNTKKNQIRTFGFAGKIFPTTNPNKIIKSNTANFFLIDDLGGTKEPYYTNLSLSNAPNISYNIELLKNIFYLLKINSTFNEADKKPNIRQLEISELEETNTISTPKYMKIKAKNILNKDSNDFRDELKITQDKLVFDIYVSENKKSWNNIGDIILDESVVSSSCDHKLHFHHPKYK